MVSAAYAVDSDSSQPEGAACGREARLLLRQTFRGNELKTGAALATSLSAAKAFPYPFSESRAILDRAVDLEGSINPGQVTYFNNGLSALVIPDEKDIKVIDGARYYELPNSTGFSVKTENGWREYVITRGIRWYDNVVTPSSKNYSGPRNYVSDLLISERLPSGNLGSPKRFLKSDPENGFLFEDPRISVLQGPDGHPVYLLSGTDYSQHAPGSTDKFVMNRFFQMKVDPKNGEIDFKKEEKYDDKTGHRWTEYSLPDLDSKGKPAFFDLSPKPTALGGAWVGLDAKNATLAQRADGKVVVRLRYRPEFDRDPTLQKYFSLYGPKVPDWTYAEQVFVFNHLGDVKKYDWSHAMDDLLSSHLGVDPIGASSKRIRPVEAKLIATDKEMPEFYDSELRTPGKPVGFGPGSRSIHVSREGRKIFIADGPWAEKHLAGEISSEAEAKKIEAEIGLMDKSHVYLAFDHKPRYLDQKSPEDESVKVTKRVYSGTVTLWDSSLTNVVRRFDDAIQPKDLHHISFTGILDLHHAGYSMGVSILPRTKALKSENAPFMLRTYSGSADAHTERYDWDVVKLLLEMSDTSRAPQIYRPIPLRH